MCENESCYPEIDLYEIPEFPGYHQLQGGLGDRPVLQSFTKGAWTSPSESETESEVDIVFTLSRPVIPALQPDTSTVEPTAHNVQVPIPQVTSLGHCKLPEIPKGLTHVTLSDSKPIETTGQSVQIPRKETKAQNERRLRAEIIANPSRRKVRAHALVQLGKQAAKIDLESAQAPLQISELQKLAQGVAWKTESKPNDLFAQYIRQATRKHHAKKASKVQGTGDESKVPANILQPLSTNSSNSQVSRTKPVKSGLVQEGEALVASFAAVQDNLQLLHNKVNSGATVEQARYATVRYKVWELAQTLGFDTEIELAKFDFLYNRRSDISK